MEREQVRKAGLGRVTAKTKMSRGTRRRARYSTHDSSSSEFTEVRYVSRTMLPCHVGGKAQHEQHGYRMHVFAQYRDH